MTSSLRALSFNVWNEPNSWDKRLSAICEVVRQMNADVVALQEVPANGPSQDSSATCDVLAERMGFPHVAYKSYPTGPKDGLAVLSRTRLGQPEAGWETAYPGLRECGMRVSTQVHGRQIAITNVHLDYADIAERERQVLDLHRWIESRASRDVEILCGDFNCTASSSIHRFLTGEQALNGISAGAMGKETAGAWLDTVAHHVTIRGGDESPTLDFVNNPRWAGRPTLETPRRVDWILIKTRLANLGVVIDDAGRFATEGIGYPPVVASDHYGVFADLKLHDLTSE
jgi:maltose 6'-phosphate phosphatase